MLIYRFLSLAALLSVGGLSRLSAQAPIQITSAVTARTPNPSNFCAAPPSETNYLTTDNAVWIMFTYSGGTAGDKGYVEWFDPNGNLYTTYTLQQSSTGGGYCYGYLISIYGYTPGSTPGNWRVRLRWNTTEVFSRPFTISVPPTSAITLVSNTSLPQAVAGAPYSFTFQASGGSAPYKWSITRGAPPAGVSLSEAGVLSGTPTSSGSYLMQLHVADSAGQILDRDVSLGVALPSLRIGVGSLAFSYTQGGAVPAPQTFSLTSTGSALPFKVTSDQTWLTATPPTGNTPGTLSVAVQPQSLAPGAYQGTLTIQSSGSNVFQQTVAVTLAVLPAGTGTPGGIISTVAGTDWTFTISGGSALKTPFGDIYGIAVDSSGNLYSADANNHVVVKVRPDGTAIVVAGNGFAGFSGEGGLAVNASLNGPQSVAVDRAGNLFITDTNNHRIRRVSAADGTISTIAGTGRSSFGGDNGPALNALLSYPRAMAVDPSGNIFFYDSGNARIREITVSGTISTVAGNGKYGYSGEGAALTVATDVTYGMALDPGGNLYFGDSEHHVRKLTPDGQTVLVAGTGQYGFGGDNGPATKATLDDVQGLAIDGTGNIYFSELNNHRIREILVNGIIVTYAGSGDFASSGDNGPALKAGMTPIALAVTNSGVLYLTDYVPKVIRRIDASLTITTVAGNGQYRNVADGNPAINSFFNSAQGLGFDSAGNLFIADFGGERVRKVTSAGIFSSVAGIGTFGCCGVDGGAATAALLGGPRSIAVDAQNNIYFADSGNHRIRRIGTDGKITTFAGAGFYGTGGLYDGDGGPATKAHLSSPLGVALDSNGNLYIADAGNHVIRRVGTDGNITTFAGTGQKRGFGGDGGPATSALLNAPSGVACDSSGTLYIADEYNHSIRVVSSGVITTLAGNQKAGYSGDGGPADKASLKNPTAVAVDPSGNVYISEYFGNRIRQVTPGGTITTVAGTGIFGFGGDGGPSAAALLNGPIGTIAIRNGVLYFTDTNNHRVRAITFGTATNAPTLGVSPTSLSLTAFSGGAVTVGIPVAASSSSAGLPVQVAVSTSSGGSWLKVDTTAANCPANVTISADPTGLAAGKYQGTVSVLSPYANPPHADIAVTFTVKDPVTGHLNTDTTPLSFPVLTGASPITAQISLTTSGSGSLSFVAGSSTFSGGPWLAVTPSNGTTSASSPDTLAITITPGSLAAGVYSGLVTLSSPDNTDPSINIPVTLVISNPLPIILLSQTGLTYQAVQGGGNPLPQTIDILNIGQGTMSWTATAQPLTGSKWLSVSPASGTVTTPFVTFSTATVNVDASGLAPGNYFGQIQVRATGANNAPQTISVVLNVFPPGTPLPPEVRPTGLVFVGSPGNPPGSQTVSIANRGTADVGFNSNKITYNNVNWMSNAPVVGTVRANSPTQMTVLPDFSARNPGVDRGVITVLFADGSAQTVNVLSVVPPAGYKPSAEPQLIRAAAALGPHASGCTPSKLVGQMTSPSPTSAASPLGQPLSMELHLADDCGNPVTDKYPASVTVRFSTGESGLTMQHTANGKWTKTWQPQSTQPTTVTAAITALAGKDYNVLGYQVLMPMVLSNGAPVPLVYQDGVRNAASYNAAPVVSPGSLVAVFGNLLADPNGQQPGTVPVPTSLGNTQVKLGDALLPLFYTSNAQLNAQVPFDIQENSQLHLVVQHGNTLSVPASVSVATAQPAIFTQNQQGTGPGAIVNGVTNVLADSKNPVHAGDVIAIYCTGLGKVIPPVREGVAASTTVLSQTVNTVTAMVGNVPATVKFAGLAPGYVGLYQVNVLVPQGLAAGDNVPVVLTAGSQVSPPATISVR